MDDFKIIYKILNILHSYMECEKPDISRLSPESLNISETKRNAILMMLLDEGYIKDMDFDLYIGDTVPSITIGENNIPRITLKGLEYLNDNSMMKKVSNMAKGVIDIIK